MTWITHPCLVFLVPLLLRVNDHITKTRCSVHWCKVPQKWGSNCFLVVFFAVLSSSSSSFFCLFHCFLFCLLFFLSLLFIFLYLLFFLFLLSPPLLPSPLCQLLLRSLCAYLLQSICSVWYMCFRHQPTLWRDGWVSSSATWSRPLSTMRWIATTSF